jgi:signal transduction histidine kinase
VRSICEGLGPQDFRFQGLADALRRLCYDFGGKTGIDCRVDIAENLPLDSLNNEMQLQVFRIVQEALTNVEKHAEATEVVVVLRMITADKGALFVSVSDDGKGFSVPGKNSRITEPQAGKLGIAHFGIRGMYERAAILGGVLTIESEKNEGTLVCLKVPLPETQAGAQEGGSPLDK